MNADVAQLVEHRTCNRKVEGSIPSVSNEGMAEWLNAALAYRILSYVCDPNVVEVP